MLNLREVATEIDNRLVSTFLRSPGGGTDGIPQDFRPVYGGTQKFQTDPHWRDYVLFYEYLHGDNGAGIGASHQTGWTGAVATLIPTLGTMMGDRVMRLIEREGQVQAAEAMPVR
jgi:hypothetical protein